jgi:GH15 family glucan-1,4-alpha-glucosidase
MKKIHKYDMGVIGNCSYLAYVDITANIKWMCMPRFDSSFIFGSLLDENKGGEFSIRPANDSYTSNQYYIENTNILCTEFTSADGKFRVIDYAPRFYQYDRFYKPLMLCRHV